MLVRPGAPVCKASQSSTGTVPQHSASPLETGHPLSDSAIALCGRAGSLFPIASEKSCTLRRNSGREALVSPPVPLILTIRAMNERAIRNLTSLSPVDEFLAPVAIIAPGEDRLRLGLPTVVDGTDGRALIIEPDSAPERS